MSLQDRMPDRPDSHDPVVGDLGDDRSRVTPVVTFGLRAAILASLVVSGAAAAGPQGIVDDPVRLVSGTGSTCCPPATEV